MFAPFEHLLGIEIKLLPDASFRCSYAIVSKKGNLLNIGKYHQIEGSLVKVLESIPRKYPLALTLSGKGIIHKLAISKGNETEGLFREVFPSVERKDFYVQECPLEDGSWVSIVRKSQADDILGKLKAAGMRVYSLSLGGLAITGIWEMITEKGTDFQVDGHLFQVSEMGALGGYLYTGTHSEEVDFALGGGKVPSYALLPYALAFQLFLHDRVELVKTDHENVDQAFHAFLGNHALRKTASVFIFSLLGLLLISFLVLSYYNSENTALNAQAGNLSAAADRGDLLRKDIALQKAKLERLGWNGGYSYAFLLNEIGGTRPRLLQLKELAFGEEKKTGSPAEIGNIIRISGETSSLPSVNNWIFELKERKWVHSVKLLRYQQDNESESYLFSLLINY
ncbi:hypothetical protein ACS5PU_02165 [Pedobacter sp. GSP4]|uniref:hypothetical protein n=1 Tax=Pedobacter sp. GSP4 TaxID=3453716 RepID=UPI003EEC809F